MNLKQFLTALALASAFLAFLSGVDHARADGLRRPAGCPSRWCGCWLGIKKGMNARSLWVARNWARVGSALPGPAAGAIAVWPHHVGIVTAVEAGRIRLLSGNDGNAVRERWRPIRGVIAWRMI